MKKPEKEGILVIPEKRYRFRAFETDGFEEFKNTILALAAEGLSKKERKKLNIDKLGQKVKKE
jgi:hypothetical protein